MTKTTVLLAIAVLGAAFDVSADDRLYEALFGYEHNVSQAPPVAPPPDDPAPGEAPCGMSIEGEFVLIHDVVCADKQRQVRLQEGATLNLNGFTLENARIYGWGGHLTIKDGTLLRAMVDISSGSDSVIRNVSVLNGVGFAVAVGLRTRISDCYFSENEAAVDLYYFGPNSSAVVENSTFENNGIGINNAKHNLASISGNLFRGNSVGVRLYTELGDAVSFNTISNNHFTDNYIGLYFHLHECYDSDSHPDGYFAYEPCMNGNRVVGNSFVGNRGSGIALAAREFETCTTSKCPNVDASIEKNLFSGNGTLPSSDLPTYVPLGIDDGITVLWPPEIRDGITITRNVALSNGDLGIEAPGALDGGGNRGEDNGNPLQCVGVACDPDADGDGLLAEQDGCPNAANRYDRSDTDGDGTGDPCDPFPLDPNNEQAQCDADLDETSIELAACIASQPVDSDGDGEPDVRDRCAGTPDGLTIDDAGCSQQQFCAAVDMSTPLALVLCIRSDWKYDEPLLALPSDCKATRNLGGHSLQRCVAR